MVIHRKLHHTLEDGPHASEHGHTVILVTRVGVHAGVVYDDFDDLITLHISIWRTCLYQIVGMSGNQRLLISEYRAALHIRFVKFTGRLGIIGISSYGTVITHRDFIGVI